MITFSTQTSGNSVMITKATFRSKLLDFTNRVERTPTLDGGAIITHNGYSDADRTLELSGMFESQAQAGELRTIFEDETEIDMSCSDGFYSGALDNLKIQNSGEFSVDFLVTTKDAG